LELSAGDYCRKRGKRGENRDWRTGDLEGLMYYFGGVVLRVGKRGWRVEGWAGSGGLVPRVLLLTIFVLRRII
jgi:hypothetical protein